MLLVSWPMPNSNPPSAYNLAQVLVLFSIRGLLTHRMAINGASVAGRLLHPSHVRALSFGQSFAFSLACLVCH